MVILDALVSMVTYGTPWPDLTGCGPHLLTARFGGRPRVVCFGTGSGQIMIHSNCNFKLTYLSSII